MRKRIHTKYFYLGMAGLGAGILAFLFITSFASASPAVPLAPPPQRELPSDETCLFCHGEPDMTTEIGGETFHLTIDEDVFAASVHREAEVRCVDCHTNITAFPHPEVTASSPRDFSVELYTACQECHSEQYEKALDSVHQTAIAAGNNNAAVCSDCHDPHAQKRLTNSSTGEFLEEVRASIPQTCAQCHTEIFETYAQSVHGAALLQEGNPDVPTCTDCHGVHGIPDPTTNTFRNSTPGLCADCHANEELMAPYGLNTNVLDTYVADFHGTTVKVFDENFPDQPTNKPVCTDCHGVHDIVPVDDPHAGIAIKGNLLVKCQQCHPDATTETFTESWLSHYEPSPDTWPLVYYVNLFYKFFIPAVLGGMGVFVLSDIYRRFIARKPNTKGASKK